MNNTLASLTAAVNARLTNGLAALNDVAGPLTTEISVLTEDVGDLATKIDKAIDEIGMLVLIGQPHFVNESPTAPQSCLKIKFAIAVGEKPTTWRDDAGLKPKAPDVVQYITQLLAQYWVQGFLPLRVLRADFVPDKNRQLYELSLETVATINQLN